MDTSTYMAKLFFEQNIFDLKSKKRILFFLFILGVCIAGVLLFSAQNTNKIESPLLSETIAQSTSEQQSILANATDSNDINSLPISTTTPDVNNTPLTPSTSCINATEKCEGTTNYTCTHNTWINQGKISGKCGFTKECEPNQTQCLDTNLYVCKNQIWESQGKIVGQCGYTQPIPLVVQNTSADQNSIFTKPSYSNKKDCLSPVVCLTRTGNQGLFNSFTEKEANHYSPKGTEWYFGSTCDSNVQFTLWDTLTHSNPTSIVHVNGCLHVFDTNTYYNITFLQWEDGNGGGFSYSRVPATLSTQ